MTKLLRTLIPFLTLGCVLSIASPALAIEGATPREKSTVTQDREDECIFRIEAIASKMEWAETRVKFDLQELKVKWANKYSFAPFDKSNSSNTSSYQHFQTAIDTSTRIHVYEYSVKYTTRAQVIKKPQADPAAELQKKAEELDLIERKVKLLEREAKLIERENEAKSIISEKKQREKKVTQQSQKTKTKGGLKKYFIRSQQSESDATEFSTQSTESFSKVSLDSRSRAR